MLDGVFSEDLSHEMHDCGREGLRKMAASLQVPYRSMLKILKTVQFPSQMQTMVQKANNDNISNQVD